MTLLTAVFRDDLTIILILLYSSQIKQKTYSLPCTGCWERDFHRIYLQWHN